MTATVAIGEFARLSNLSVKTLRHYHDIGLLAQQVGDFPFAFVAPLGANYDENRHVAS